MLIVFIQLEWFTGLQLLCLHMTNNKFAGNGHSQNKIQALHQPCSNGDTRRQSNLDNKFIRTNLHAHTQHAHTLDGGLSHATGCYNNSWHSHSGHPKKSVSIGLAWPMQSKSGLFCPVIGTRQSTSLSRKPPQSFEHWRERNRGEGDKLVNVRWRIMWNEHSSWCLPMPLSMFCFAQSIRIL